MVLKYLETKEENLQIVKSHNIHIIIVFLVQSLSKI